MMESGWFALSQRAALNVKPTPGDCFCIYISGVGIVATAVVASPPQAFRQEEQASSRYPIRFRIEAFERTVLPLQVDAERRGRLDAFADKNTKSPWSWFVQAAHRLTQHDFDILTKEGDC